MDDKTFSNLAPGDLIQHKLSGHSYAIHNSIKEESGRVSYIGVRTIHVTNPEEWELSGHIKLVKEQEEEGS